MNRLSNTRSPANVLQIDQLRSNEESEKDMWSSLLDSVASGKKLPEKNIIVLGGNPETQKEFLDILDSELPKRLQEWSKRKPPIANEFALGYTYQDVLDADHEDILARLSLYLLSEPKSPFAPLVKPLFTPRTVSDSLIVILLDWAEPWLWIRQLRDRVLFLKEIINSTDDDTKDAMAETMKDWQHRRRGAQVYDSAGGSTSGEGDVTIPLSQGEWDEGLGLPICVVCHSADKIDILEKEQGWKEEEFDFILQFLRTILMKHGASLVYTSISDANSLPTLIHSSLGIHSLLKKQSLKYNVIDRDKIVIPPNWDSWGKIRVLREGFDVEGISSAWSVDIQQKPSSPIPKSVVNENEVVGQPEKQDRKVYLGHTFATYEDTIKNPRADVESNPNNKKNGIDVEVTKMQDFLLSQQEIIERLHTEEEIARDSKEPRGALERQALGKGANAMFEDSGRVHEHIGPVQFNVGGIQVDSESMSKTSRDPELSNPEKESQIPATPDGEALASFFAGLMKRGRSSSPRSTPT